VIVREIPNPTLCRSQDQICSRKRFRFLELFLRILSSWNFNVKVNPIISWNGHNSFQRIFLFKSRHFNTPQPRGLLLSRFFFENVRSNVCEKYWLTKDCSAGFMNPLHSPRNEHSKTEFGWRIPRKSSENRRLFLGANLILRPALKKRNKDWKHPNTHVLTHYRSHVSKVSQK